MGVPPRGALGRSHRHACLARSARGRDARFAWVRLTDEIASEGDDPEVVTEFRAAHEVTQATESGRDVDPGDVAMAVNAYRALYEHVINDRTAP